MILAVYGGAFDGVAAGWSIDGEQHIGIGGSHNNYETDSSPLKSDLNQYGTLNRLVMSQFHEVRLHHPCSQLTYQLYNLQPDAATADYNLGVIKEFRRIRFNESIAKNPYFFCESLKRTL